MNNARSDRYYHRTALIQAPLARVWNGLIDPECWKRWACDAIELDPRPGGVFRPGGPHCVTVEPADGKVLALEAERRLELSWPMAGADITVLFELEPLEASEAQTRLKFRCSSANGWPEELSISALWALYLTGLRWALEHTDGSEAPMRFDFSQPKSGLVWLGMAADTPPAQLYALFSVPRELRRWVSPKVRIEAKEGGRMDFGWGDRGPTTVSAVKKNRLLVHGWKDPGHAEPTRVTWSVMPERGGSRLEFLHDGFSEHDETLTYKLLWTAALATLKDLAENARSVGLSWEAPESAAH